jgi:hypothetical protein
MNPAVRLMFFVVAAISAAVLAVFAKHKPARVTRIIMTLGALVFAGLSYPEAAEWAKLHRQHRDRASANVQAPPPANAEPRQLARMEALIANPAFERTAASALRLLAVPSSLRSSAAAQRERCTSLRAHARRGSSGVAHEVSQRVS